MAPPRSAGADALIARKPRSSTSATPSRSTRSETARTCRRRPCLAARRGPRRGGRSRGRDRSTPDRAADGARRRPRRTRQRAAPSGRAPARRRDRGTGVENRSWLLSATSSTFHGRDIFAPAAAHLATGAPFADVGPEVDRATLVELAPPGRPHRRDSSRPRWSTSILRQSSSGRGRDRARNGPKATGAGRAAGGLAEGAQCRSPSPCAGRAHSGRHRQASSSPTRI